MLLTSLTTGKSDFEAGTGWQLKPEGACLGDVCVPLPDGALDGDRVDVDTVADRMGMPLVHDDEHRRMGARPMARNRPNPGQRRGARVDTARPRRQPVLAVVVAWPEGAAARMGTVLRLFT